MRSVRSRSAPNHGLRDPDERAGLPALASDGVGDAFRVCYPSSARLVRRWAGAVDRVRVRG
jgi:hypothetical protein